MLLISMDPVKQRKLVWLDFLFPAEGIKMSTYEKSFTLRLTKEMRHALKSHAERQNKSESKVIKELLQVLIPDPNPELKETEVIHEKTN